MTLHRQVFAISSASNQQSLDLAFSNAPMAAAAAAAQVPNSATASTTSFLAGSLPLQRPARFLCSPMDSLQQQELVLWPACCQPLVTAAQNSVGHLQQLPGVWPQEYMVHSNTTVADGNASKSRTSESAAPQFDEQHPLDIQHISASSHVPLAQAVKFTAVVSSPINAAPVIKAQHLNTAVRVGSGSTSAAAAGQTVPMDCHQKPARTEAATIVLPGTTRQHLLSPGTSGGLLGTIYRYTAPTREPETGCSPPVYFRAPNTALTPPPAAAIAVDSACLPAGSPAADPLGTTEVSSAATAATRDIRPLAYAPPAVAGLVATAADQAQQQIKHTAEFTAAAKLLQHAAFVGAA